MQFLNTKFTTIRLPPTDMKHWLQGYISIDFRLSKMLFLSMCVGQVFFSDRESYYYRIDYRHSIFSCPSYWTIRGLQLPAYTDGFSDINQVLILYNWSYTEKPSWSIKSLYYELLSFKCNFQVHVFEFTLFRPNFVISIYHFLLWPPPNIDYNNFEYFNYMIFCHIMYTVEKSQIGQIICI